AGLADHARQRSGPVYRRLDEMTAADIAQAFASLEEKARADLLADLPCEHQLTERTVIRRALDLRYLGVEAGITIVEPANGDFLAAFTAEHEKLYGYLQAGRVIEVVAARVEAVLPSSVELNISHHMPGDVSKA